MSDLIAWVEIPAQNFSRAVDFYSKILNIEFESKDYDQEKMACFPNGEGAISWAENFKPSSDGVLVSFNVSAKLNEVIYKIEENGGKIVQPKTKIEAEGRGYFALFIDSEGNKIGLYGD